VDPGKQETEAFDMDRSGSARPQWVWAGLVLQSVVSLLSVWSAGQMLISWPRYAAYGTQMIPQIVRSIVEAILLGVSLVGLWQSKRWGWLLGLLVDAAICLLYLYYALEYPRLILNPRYLALNIWEFAAFAVLLHLPVRAYFQGKRDLPGPTAPPGRLPIAEINAMQRSFRGLVYIVAAVAATCLVTTFSLAVALGDKAGGGRGFLFLLVIGFEIGGAASFLFVVLLTVAARGFGAGRFVVWLIAGGLLAPGLILGMGVLVKTFLIRSGPLGTGPPNMLLAIFFTGPVYLFQVWWLAIPAGIVTSFLCYQMYPWAFGQSK
jgi:hypothetical protein